MFGVTSVDEEIYFKAVGNSIVDDPLSALVTQDSGKENVFGPLGLTASFYLTPELKMNNLLTPFRRDGKLERWADQGKIIEHPGKGINKHLV